MHCLLLSHVLPVLTCTGMPDIERLNRKLEAQRCSLADLCQMYRASSVLPRLEEALRCHEVKGFRVWEGLLPQ
jgi:DNA mismatch repair ATPase MutS